MNIKYSMHNIYTKNSNSKRKQLLQVSKTFKNFSNIYFIRYGNTLFISNRKYDIFYTLKYESYFISRPFHKKNRLIKDNGSIYKMSVAFQVAGTPKY